MLAKRLIKSNDAGGGACTNTVDLYNPFPDGGGVALYQLNGDATDVSGNYNGTATNVTYGTGVFGQAGVFNGSSSSIVLPTAVIPADNFTISLWVNSNDVTPQENLITQYVFASGSNGRFVSYIQNGYFIVAVESNGSGTNFNYVLSDNTWYHIALVKNGTWECFIDGNSVGTWSDTVNITTSYNTQIGSRVGSSDYFTGSIDQVRIFNRALRPYEVEALYTEEYCTPTIVPSEHFNTVLYTGTGATNPVTGVGFQPDFVWLKKRSGVDDHFVFDSIRGAKSIYPNLTNAEDSFTFSFDTDGFTVPVSGGTNGNGDTFVAWNFKAGGAAATNTDGTITSQVSANTEAGFSIVTFTGNGSTASVGHGLGQKPSIIFTKNRSVSEGWFTQQYMYVPSGNAAYGYLNTNAAFTGFTDSLTNDTVMQQGGTNGQNYVSYCFAEVEGFSNFGSYVGTGASGNTVVTGFEPAFVMIKNADDTGDWAMFDNKRNPTNPVNNRLMANLSSQESQNSTTRVLNFLTNGFSINSTNQDINAINDNYIYMAFAADPTAVEPTLEDSFNTVLYSGNSSSSHSITGVGFQPDLTWIKNRSANAAHWITDSVRGAGKGLQGQSTDAELTSLPELMSSFNSDGFTVGYISNPTTNLSGNNYVAWNWKGAEIPAINSNGSIPSVVSANPAAGFSIVSYTGNGGTATVGHGLDSVVDLLIVKGRETTNDWSVLHKDNTNGNFLQLNLTAAESGSGSIFGNPTARPTDSVFTIGNTGETGTLNKSYIAYCFAEVAGFSKFGSYTGNGLPLGPTIDLGFEPAFVMYKCTSQVGNWIMVDNKRALTNPRTPHLRANTSSADDFGAGEYINFIANGFQPSGVSNFNNNSNGQTYIYMAFADQF